MQLSAAIRYVSRFAAKAECGTRAGPATGVWRASSSAAATCPDTSSSNMSATTAIDTRSARTRSTRICARSAAKRSRPRIFEPGPGRFSPPWPCESSRGEARASTRVRAAEQVSRHLGNTVAVCRKCYIHPAIFDGYLDGSLVKTLEQRVSRYQSSNIDRMSAEEAAVTAFLRLRLRSAERLRPAAGELTAGNARRSIRLKVL